MKYAKSFLKSYANLPFNSRREIIAVIDDEPIAWNVAKIEIENKTELGSKILEKLVNMGIIDGQK